LEANAWPFWAIFTYSLFRSLATTVCSSKPSVAVGSSDRILCWSLLCLRTKY
jgi:hypothetical protein